MEFEPIFVCLAKIVQNFVDENTRIGKPNIIQIVISILSDFDSMREHRREEHRSQRVEDSREEQISEMKRGYEEYR